LIPVLRNASSNPQYSQLLARLLKLIPLKRSNKGIKTEGHSFFEVLNSQEATDVDGILVNLRVKADLRDYQRKGIAWILNLTKYGFNCALCDEMGLGKTIQSLSALSVVNMEHKQEVEKSERK